MTDPACRIIVAITGASGAIYAQRLLDQLERTGCELHVIATETAQKIAADELGIDAMSAAAWIGRESERITFYDNDNLFSTPASGSVVFDGMVVCPCSTHTLSAVATGLADTLILRAAYVCLKQRRRLVLLHREMPLTEIDLENMLRITRAGGIVCPANPPFYLHPKKIDDLVDAVIGRVMDLLDAPHDLPIRWSP